MRNDVDGIKWKFIWYYPKDQVVDHMKKSIEEVIWYAVDGPEFIKEQNLVHFDFWVKNKAQNEASNLKQ